ncbi:MAG: filamentous hemagglutinin N-terminal domain-containing protein, partial [Rubrivivax sp.]
MPASTTPGTACSRAGRVARLLDMLRPGRQLPAALPRALRRRVLRRARWRPSLVALSLAGIFGAPIAWAQPDLAQVVRGSAQLRQSGSTLSVTTSDGAVIHWNRFDIAAGHTTRFIQPDAASQVLNRVVGGDPSRILGQLQSNGRVFLINPNGVAFGPGARVDVAALVVSTLNLSDADFAAGHLRFEPPPGSAALQARIRNEGTIRTADGGFVYLVAPQVENTGVIHAPDGQVLLAAGHRVTIVNPQTPEVSWEVAAPASTAVNLGEVVARRIALHGRDVEQGGRLRATTAVVGEDGRIRLQAARRVVQAPQATMEARSRDAQGTAKGGRVEVLAGAHAELSGRVDVASAPLPPPALPSPSPPSGDEAPAPAQGGGGDVQVLAPEIVLAPGLAVEASGAAGGGRVRVGGNWQGRAGGAMAEAFGDAPNARDVRMLAGAEVRADATRAGPGGEVVLWSDGATRFDGRISARGGEAGGDGGRVETSGHAGLGVGASARVDAGATAGARGAWLLDPRDIVITSSGSDPLESGSAFGNQPDADLTLDAGALSAATSHVTLQANNDVRFTSSVAILSTGVNLTVQAGRGIEIDADLSVTGTLDLRANEAAVNPAVVLDQRQEGPGGISIGAGRQVQAGSVVVGVAASVPGDVQKQAGDVTVGGDALLQSTAGTLTIAAPPTHTTTIESGATLRSRQALSVTSGSIAVAGVVESIGPSGGESSPAAGGDGADILLEARDSLTLSSTARVSSEGGDGSAGFYGTSGMAGGQAGQITLRATAATAQISINGVVLSQGGHGGDGGSPLSGPGGDGGSGGQAGAIEIAAGGGAGLGTAAVVSSIGGQGGDGAHGGDGVPFLDSGAGGLGGIGGAGGSSGLIRIDAGSDGLTVAGMVFSQGGRGGSGG